MHRLLNTETYRKIIWDSTEKDLNLSTRDIRPIRWFILFWVGIVSLWGSAQLLLGDYVKFPFGGFIIIISWMSWHPPFSKFMPPPLSAGEAPAPSTGVMVNPSSSNMPLPPSAGEAPAFQAIDALYTLRLDQAYYPLNVIWVGLMALQLCLHWFCLSGKLQRRWYGIYFLLQGICVLISSLIWSDTIIALGLYLVLVIEALSLLKQVRRIVVVVATYLGFFLLTIVWQLTHWVIWMTFGSILLLVLFLIGWLILSIQQVHARSQLEAAHLQLAAYAMRLEELTLVNERQRLARELHDTLAQDLVGLTLQLERVDLHLEKRRFERARELVQQAMTRARATLAEARSAIDDLRTHPLDPDDLLLALEREIERFRATTSISCSADLSALAVVPVNLCEHVLRAITEGLTNVARHSQAHQVWICAQCAETMLTIEVRDDGIGFESSAAVTQQGHYGLLGLRERARLVGGYLDIESAVGKGTALRLCLPVNQRGGLE
jgi:NarL family two-component system sensor histidine kinase YdfH